MERLLLRSIEANTSIALAKQRMIYTAECILNRIATSLELIFCRLVTAAIGNVIIDVLK